MLHIGDGWEMTMEEVVAAMYRCVPKAFGYFGPVAEVGIIDPWELRQNDRPVLATRPDYVRAPRKIGAPSAWHLCAAELVLTHEVLDWSEFAEADVRYAVSSFPHQGSEPASDDLLVLWIWFSTLKRTDGCFVFVLNRTEEQQLAWLQFLSRSSRLAIRNGGTSTSAAVNLWVTLEGEALELLRSKVPALAQRQ